VARPRILVGPEPVADWVSETIQAGGADAVRATEAGAADAIVWMHPSDVDGLRAAVAAAPDARWVQLPWAGVEDFGGAGLFEDGRVWTCGKGVYAEPVAELALALGLAGLRQVPEFVTATSWSGQAGRSLYEGRVTILGGGGITESLLGLLAPLRVEATVVRRNPEPLAGAARTLGPGGLHDALAGADLVVLALALTPETTGIIGARELSEMEDHAWLVNVARGRHVITGDLVRALETREIGGAGLDVTDPEPLPDGHPLWGLDNCVITPHTGNTPEMARAPLARRIRENVRRFVDGDPLIGVVDAVAGY
jgi:phosphoglycerate dehydrogenase-like enzyme